MEQRIEDLLASAGRSHCRAIALTGAGISAESGIPTFRGKEGYWTVGSRVYHPQELATRHAFGQMPSEVWQWYLYRRTVCRAAQPNPAHHALVALEQAMGDRFRLITQNVDGLHIRAGSSLERTYQIHGNIDYMRCANQCSVTLWPIPESIGQVTREQALSAEEIALLRCPRCGARSRPHVLWFDEYYNEELYRYESSLMTANAATLVLIIGTSASTNLPSQVVSLAAQRGAVIIDINIDDNPFAKLAERLPTGAAIRGRAAEVVPEIAARLATLASASPA